MIVSRIKKNMMIVLIVLTVVYPVLVHCCYPLSFSVIDLSHTLDNDSLKWPTSSDFKFTILSRGQQQGKDFWYETNKFDTPEHISTHLDAPAHFAEKGWRVHEIPAEGLVASGIVMDIRDKVAYDADYRLRLSDVEAWECRHGAIPCGAAVFMWSGWEARYPDKRLTFNTETVDDFSTFHFPGFHPEAVTWLIKNRKIRMIGVDTPSTDFGQSQDFQVHRILGEANVLGLENVNNLGQLPSKGSTIIVAPIKLNGGSGVPVRLLAILNILDQDGQGFCQTSTGEHSFSLSNLLFVCVVIVGCVIGLRM